MRSPIQVKPTNDMRFSLTEGKQGSLKGANMDRHFPKTSAKKHQIQSAVKES